VERPASVVKELLENAIDAGAKKIRCEIKGAGKICIRVRDEGVGIGKEDLPLALAPHATSKILSIEDLGAITTLGFRGEALASIAAVSKLTLTSKTKEEENAFSVSVEGPEQHPKISPAAHPVGTTVEVLELFFNTPARRRFLKSDRTEMARIKDVFTRIALSHPECGFELLSEGKTLLRVNAQENDALDLKRMTVLLGSDFSTPGFSVCCEDPYLKIRGMLLPPPSKEEALSERIYLFLNGRPIADKVVIHAVKEGFYEVLGTVLPCRCVLYLCIDPDKVDVNVHPRKDEVRFHETTLVHDLITDTIVYTLRKNGIGASPQSALLDCFEPSKPAGELTLSDTNGRAAYQEQDTSAASAALPSFPNNASFIDLSLVKDRGDPEIKKGAESCKDSSPAASAVSPKEPSFSVGAGNKTPSVVNPRAQGKPPASLNCSPKATSGSIDAPNTFYKKNYDDHVRAQNQAVSSLNVDSELWRFVDNMPVYPQNGIEFLQMVDDTCALVRSSSQFFLVNLLILGRYFLCSEYMRQIRSTKVSMEKLTMPLLLPFLDESLTANIKKDELLMARCGFEVKVSNKKVKVNAYPRVLKGTNLAHSLPLIFEEIILYKKVLEEGECPLTLALYILKFSGMTPLSLDLLPFFKHVENEDALRSMEGAVLPLNLKQLAANFKKQYE